MYLSLLTWIFSLSPKQCFSKQWNVLTVLWIVFKKIFVMSSVVVKDGEGSFIPATQRPDGSWRKARRVKDGYVPQEEVPLYESKGKQWANRKPLYPVGLDPDIVKKKEIELAKKNNSMYSPIPGLIIDPNCETKSKKKKKKKKNNSNTSGLAEDDNEKDEIDITTATSPSDKPKLKKQSVNPTSQPPKQEEPLTPAVVTITAGADPIKRIKNLKKKLREIEALEQKIATGETKSLDKDQLEKASRKLDVLSEILALELSLENK